MQGGYISRIELENFMCHRKFAIDLHPEMNIIVGRNGSGKSAILTGLIVGLGGGARATARGNSFKELIRHGTNDAFITITIENPVVGPSMQRFGRRFSIQRRIGTRSNAWSIRNLDNGAVVSTKSSDVHDICQFLGFQPDNVLVMLNQENAKEFLVGSTPQSKFNQLDKALSISAQLEKFHAAEHSLREMEEKYHLESSRKRICLAERDKLGSMIAKAQAERDSAEPLDLLRAVLQWREVERKEHLLNKAAEELDAACAKRDQLDARRDNQPDAEEAEAQMAELQAALDTATAEKDAAAETLETLERQFKAEDAKVRAMKKHQQDAATDVGRAQQDLEALRAESAAGLEVDVEALRSQLLAEQTKANALRQEHERQSTLLTNLDGRIADDKDAVKRAQDALKFVRNDLKHAQSELTKLENGGETDPIAGFGRQAQAFRALDREIARGQWKQRPIGPLARYLKVNASNTRDETAWAETVLMSVASMYWVQSPDDRTQLYRLLAKHRLENISVLLWTAEQFNFREPQGGEGFKTFFDIVEVEDRHIRRILVDQLKVEDVLYCSSQERAHSELRHGQVHTTIYSAGEGWRRLENKSRSSDSTYVRPRRDGGVTLSVATSSTAELQQTYRARVEDLGRAVETAKADLAREERALRESERSKMVQEDARRTTDGEIRKVVREAERLQKVIDREEARASGAGDEDRDEYDRDEIINHKRREVMRLEAVYDDLEPQIARLGKLALTAKSRVDDQREVVTAKQDAIKDADARYRSHQKRLVMARRAANEFETAQDGVQRAVARAEAAVDEAQQAADAAAATAQEKVGDRPDLTAFVGRENHQIEEAIAVGAARAARLEELGAEIDEFIARKDRLDQKLETMDETIERKEMRKTEMKSQLSIRKRGMRQSNSDIIKHITEDYQRYIQERGFTGDLEVNTIEKRVVAHATPAAAPTQGGNENDGSSAPRAARATSTLSGGEKSFTQICLLLSVWRNISTGLVAMDEYDVFMDEQFRAVSMEALIRTITGKPAQGILITPQGLPRAIYEKYKFSNKFHVHNLENPRP